MTAACQKTCPTHGEYTSKRLPLPESFRDTVVWSSCPACETEELARRGRADTLDRGLYLSSNLEAAGILERFRDKNFDNYTPETEAQRAILTAVRAYCWSFAANRKKGRCMALLGAPGLGKTHLGVSMLREVVGQGWTGLYARGYDFLLALKDAWAGRGRKAAEIDVIKQYVKPDLLVLDEIGVQYFTDAEETMFFQIIENRYGANRPTIIISNLGKPAPDKRRGPDGRRLPGNNQTKDIEDALGFRAFDRLMEGGGICLEFFGESYRRRPPLEVSE